MNSSFSPVPAHPPTAQPGPILNRRRLLAFLGLAHAAAPALAKATLGAPDNFGFAAAPSALDRSTSNLTLTVDHGLDFERFERILAEDRALLEAAGLGGHFPKASEPFPSGAQNAPAKRIGFDAAPAPGAAFLFDDVGSGP